MQQIFSNSYQLIFIMKVNPYLLVTRVTCDTIGLSFYFPKNITFAP